MRPAAWRSWVVGDEIVWNQPDLGLCPGRIIQICPRAMVCKAGGPRLGRVYVVKYHEVVEINGQAITQPRSYASGQR